MYSFTTVSVRYKRLKANEDFYCACCQEENKGDKLIKQGYDFFWITGHRRYERLVKIENFSSFMGSEFVFYRPRGIRATPRYLNVSKEEFKDLILAHKICPNCFELMAKFRSGKLGKEYEKPYKFEYRFTVRIYNSLKHYSCQCCATKINPGMDYVREGHRGKFCLECIRRIKPLIGKEFSYGE